MDERSRKVWVSFPNDLASTSARIALSSMRSNALRRRAALLLDSIHSPAHPSALFIEASNAAKPGPLQTPIGLTLGDLGSPDR